MGKLKIGVFGAHRGMTMIEVLLMHPEAELVAVCDRYVPQLEAVGRAADKAGIKVALYENFEDFFKHDMDAVVLANYATEHAPYAVRLLKSGRHVMSELLPCETMAQAVELVEAVEESGKVYTYAENCCYLRAPFEMWRRAENGEIGEVMYAEGEYVHDCSGLWPDITYGERDHWRNHWYSTFYCTHSLGPLLTISGRRPVQVVGFETQQNPQGLPQGRACGGLVGAVEFVTLDNGALARSLHGELKREPASHNYTVYGMKGMFDTERFDKEELQMTSYVEGEKLCEGELTHYAPERFISPDMAKKFSTHNGCDFYATHFFIEKILGNPEGRYAIDIYQALDMGFCGILAYRSILNGNQPIRVPDFRNKEEREPYRNDRACTTPAVAGDQLLPSYHTGNAEIPDEAYEAVRQEWLRREEERAKKRSETKA